MRAGSIVFPAFRVTIFGLCLRQKEDFLFGFLYLFFQRLKRRGNLKSRAREFTIIRSIFSVFNSDSKSFSHPIDMMIMITFSFFLSPFPPEVLEELTLYEAGGKPRCLFQLENNELVVTEKRRWQKRCISYRLHSFSLTRWFLFSAAWLFRKLLSRSCSPFKAQRAFLRR